MSAYRFDTQLADGEKGELTLDTFFRQWFTIAPATREQQRKGVDRIFTNKTTGAVLAVEYKTDHRASSSGNAFVETISVDTANKRGWAYTSSAAWLFYYVPDDDLCYVIPFAELRRMLPHWLKACEVRAIPNKGYKTHGLLVPLKEFERIALEVVTITA